MVTLGELEDGLVLDAFNFAYRIHPALHTDIAKQQWITGTFSSQDPVHSWKGGPSEVMTVESKKIRRET